MSIAGRCIARSTSSGILVGPGMARNSRPARTVIAVGPCCLRTGWWVADSHFYAALRCKKRPEKRRSDVGYLLVSRQPASSASSTEQNQRVPLLIFILICAYQRLVGR